MDCMTIVYFGLVYKHVHLWKGPLTEQMLT